MRGSSVRAGISVSAVTLLLGIVGGAVLLGAVAATAPVEQVAAFMLVMSIVAAAGPLGALGLGELAAAACSEGSGRSRRRHLLRYVSLAIPAAAVAAAVAGAAALVAVNPAWAVVTAAIVGADVVRNVVLQALHGAGDSVSPSLLGRSANVAAGLFAVAAGATPVVLVATQAVAVAACVAAGLWRFIAITTQEGGRIPVSPVRQIVVDGCKVVVASVANITRHQVPVWTIAALGSATDVVVYGLAAKAGGMLLLPGIAVSTGARSKIAAAVAVPADLRTLLAPLTRKQFAASTLAVVALVAYGPWALGLVAPDVVVPRSVLAAIAIGPLVWAWVGDAFWSLRLAGHHATLATTSWAGWIATAATSVLYLAGITDAVLPALMLSAGWAALTIGQHRALQRHFGVTFAPRARRR